VQDRPRSRRSLNDATALLWLTIVAVAVALFVVPSQAVAKPKSLERTAQVAPKLGPEQVGATVQDVTIETYGVTKEHQVRRYLTLGKGSRLEQNALNADFNNLVKLGGYRVRVEITPAADKVVTLHWIIMDPWFRLTAHPVYEEAPLADPTRGVGFVVSAPKTKQGSYVALVTSQNRFAHHQLATFTSPIQVNPKTGREGDLVVNVIGNQDAFRVSFPRGLTIYNWTVGAEVRYLVRSTRGTQFDIGLRDDRSISNEPTGIIAPSILSSSLGPATNLIVEVGMSHACPEGPAGGWYPPYCHTQYRADVYDGIGGIASTSRFQAYVADVAHYIPVHTSTLALHAVEARTGGVIPESRILCSAALRAFSQPFCGTDAQLFQVEYRIRDAASQSLKFSLFTETGSTRVRGGTQPFAPQQFQWHADSGIEIRYRGVAFDLARGSLGYRINLALGAQTF
jgi:hypothetical protein